MMMSLLLRVSLLIIFLLILGSESIVIKKVKTMMDRPDNYETIEEQEARLGYSVMDTPLFPELMF